MTGQSDYETRGILQQAMAARRSYPVALAHRLSTRKPGDPMLAALNAHYSALTPADQLRCRIEMLEIKEARRGAHEAQIVERAPCASP